MPILETAFTCSNGHSFTANAKSRSRCPICGVLVKKDFASNPISEVSRTSEPLKEPILVRAGKPRATTKPHVRKSPVQRVKPTAIKPVLSKVSGGAVSVTRLKGKGIAPKVNKAPKATNVTHQAQAASNLSQGPKLSYVQQMMRRALG